MSTINYLTVRNTILPVVNAVTANYSTLTGSTITATSMNLTSATISLGASTNQTYNNFSNGSYAPISWITAKSAMTSANKTVQSSNGLYQMIIANATSGLFLSSDSGITWSTLTGGLPVLTGSAYWSDGAISANGQYITLSIYGGSLWMSADYGRTFALTNQPTPSIWLPLNGNTTDSMGSSTVTATGSPGYVTLNYPGYTAQAVNLANTAGGTATRYIRGTWAGATNFTVSFWFNAQTLNGTAQLLFSTYNTYCVVLINGSNQLSALIPTGGGSNYSSMGTSSTLVVNTWYYVSLLFQTNGLCSLYLNNSLVGSVTNSQGVGSLTTSVFELSGYDSNQSFAFNGYVDDLRITNSVSTYVPIPLLQPNIWLPFENNTADLGSQTAASSTIYLPFEGNVTDSMGFSTPNVTGPVTYVAANREGYTGQAIRLTNTAGGTAAQYVRGTWSGTTNFTVSFWFNAPSAGGNFQIVFSAYNSSLSVALNGDNSLTMYIPNASYILSGVLSVNTWHFVTSIFRTNGTCSFYIDNNLIGSATNTGGFGTSSGFYELSGTDNSQVFAFNGTIDDFRFYNYAITYAPVSIVTVTGSLSYVPGVVGLNAVNLVNTAGGTPTNYIRGAWTGSPNITVSGWFSMSTFQTGGGNVHLFFAYTGVFGVYCNPSQQIQYFIPNGGATAGLNIAASNKISLNTWYHIYCTFRTGGLCELYINGSLIGSATNTGGVGTLSTTQFAIGTLDNSTTGAFDGYVDDFRIYNAAIPYHILFPQNYRSLALSGTGQYALATAASGWVVGSSDVSKTWSKQAVNVGTQSALSMNHTGQYQLVATGPAAGSIMPNQTGLVANTWTQGGVTWTASASSIYNGSTLPQYLFAVSGTSWYSGGGYNPSGTYIGTVSTSVQGLDNVLGEWAQIQSSVPLVLNSYTFLSGGNGKVLIPKSYYIIGSMDGSTWFPLQFSSMTTKVITTINTLLTPYLTINYNGTFSAGSGSITTTSYSTSVSPYLYFRIVVNTIWNFSANDVVEIGEWYMNFSNSVSYSSNYGSTWLNASSTVSNESVALSSSGQYALSTNSVAPLARLTFDNTNVDSQGVLAAPTVVGTSFSYSTSTKVVGTHSINFANTAGASSGMTYLNYTVPAVLNKPSMLTMSCWIYPTGLPSVGNQSMAMSFNNNSNVDGAMLGILPSGRVLLNYYTTTSIANGVQSLAAINLNTWTHLAMTFGSGSVILYVNGISQVTTAVTGSLSLSTGANITNLFIGTQDTTYAGAFAGYVDDVRLYTSVLNADEVTALYNNPAITQTIAVSSSYLPITSYTKPVLPGITANIVDSAVSQTGQYMVAVTSSTTNNVYYSTDYGATFTALTVGSSAMVSCSISYDGSYLTVENATTVYTLNKNTKGYSVTVGNQAGLINQAQNTIAIGNQAGRTNQSANSIVLNASGSALDAVAPGFYVSPVATTTSSNATSFALLGYGTDNQVTQTNVTITSAGAITLGNSVMPAVTSGTAYGSTSLVGQFGGGNSNYWGSLACNIIYTNNTGGWTQYTARLQRMVDVSSFAYIDFMPYVGNGFDYNGIAFGTGNTSTGTEFMRIKGNGYVGIGTTNPNFPFTCMGSAACFGWNTAGTTYSDPQFPGVEGISLRTYSGGYGIISTSADTALSLGKFGTGVVANFTRSPSIGTACLAVGNISVTASTTAYNTSSDSRLKENIQDVADIRSMIDNLRPRTYHFIRDENKENQIGFIAQEVRENYPQYVSGQETETEYLSMDYGKFSPFAISACKDLYNENDALKARVIVLESQLTDVLLRLAALEAK